jgi:hypothetical protein
MSLVMFPASGLSLGSFGCPVPRRSSARSCARVDPSSGTRHSGALRLDVSTRNYGTFYSKARVPYPRPEVKGASVERLARKTAFGRRQEYNRSGLLRRYLHLYRGALGGGARCYQLSVRPKYACRGSHCCR